MVVLVYWLNVVYIVVDIDLEFFFYCVWIDYFIVNLVVEYVFVNGIDSFKNGIFLELCGVRVIYWFFGFVFYVFGGKGYVFYIEFDCFY